MVKDKPKKVGTLLPLQSLRSEKEKRASFKTGELFLDWLAKTKQTAWQMLPLHETDVSPYKSYGIGLSSKLCSQPANKNKEKAIKFIEANQDWLDNYALFEVLSRQFGTKDWRQWPLEIRYRHPDALENWQLKFNKEINQEKLKQAHLHIDYMQIRKKARDLKIDLIGDLPFYLDVNSPLVWQYQNLFKWERGLNLIEVSGIPQNRKSYFGRQVWGHPLYNWSEDKLDQITSLFELRLRYLNQLFDWVRLDYAKGFFKFGVINLKTNQDCFRLGPGKSFLENLIAIGRKWNLKIFAEDIGSQVKQLRLLMKKENIPGIKILRYAYDEKQKKFVPTYLDIDKYPINTFAYTTTHDTSPLRCYLDNLPDEILGKLKEKWRIKENIEGRSLSKTIIKRLIKSPAKMVIIPLQDWLYTKTRINVPGTEGKPGFKNWQYVMEVPIEKLPLNLI